jgi:hypothetical protein
MTEASQQPFAPYGGVALSSSGFGLLQANPYLTVVWVGFGPKANGVFSDPLSTAADLLGIETRYGGPLPVPTANLTSNEIGALGESALAISVNHALLAAQRAPLLIERPPDRSVIGPCLHVSKKSETRSISL